MDKPDQSVIQRARELAIGLAQSVGSRKDDENVNSILKRTRFTDMKEQIDMARKPRMRTIEQFLCDQCDCIIQKEDQGYIIKGNIYTADPATRGGLVGDNFPPIEDGKIDPAEVMETVLCKGCFLRAVGLTPDFTPLEDYKDKGHKPMAKRKNRGATPDVAELLTRTLRQ